MSDCPLGFFDSRCPPGGYGREGCDCRADPEIAAEMENRRTELLREAARLLRRTHVAMPSASPIGVDADDLESRIRKELGE